MTFFDILQKAQTGDLLLVKGEGLISKIIRSLTGETFSHVAMICRSETETLFVREFVEGKGFREWALTAWLDDREGQAIYFGFAPEPLNRDKIWEASTEFSFSRRYGYLSLPLVWVAQLFNLNISTVRKVCSTYVQHCWAAGGFEFKETADPGDYLDFCEKVRRIY